MLQNSLEWNWLPLKDKKCLLSPVKLLFLEIHVFCMMCLKKKVKKRGFDMTVIICCKVVHEDLGSVLAGLWKIVYYVLSKEFTEEEDEWLYVACLCVHWKNGAHITISNLSVAHEYVLHQQVLPKAT